MKFEPEKLLNSIELRLSGRTAIFAVSEGVMAVALWLILRDYPTHPVLSIIGTSLLLLGILVFPILGLLGKARPDEGPIKSFTNIEQLGVSIVHGIGSQREMVQIMRAIWGGRRIPTPSFVVQGSAGNEKNYTSLKSDHAEAIVDQIEREIEKQLSEAIAAPAAPTTEHQLEQPGSDIQETPRIVKGKTSD